MKKDEMKIGLYVGGTIPSRVLWFDERWAVVTNSYSDMPVVLDRKATIVDPSTPAELTAAGVPDSLRLIEQQAWREGVELYQYPANFGWSNCWIHIDGKPAGYIGSHPQVIESDGPMTFKDARNVTGDPAYSIHFGKSSVRDFVSKFRSERREAGSNPPAAERADRPVESGDRAYFSATFHLADGRCVGVAADMHCGNPVLNVTELEAASPSPSPAATRTADVRLRSWVDTIWTGSISIDDVHIRGTDIPLDTTIAPSPAGGEKP